MAGRPRSPRVHALSRDSIIASAVAVADTDGLSSVSMRAVAKNLGVEAMSLYNHVKNKDDMLDGMVDAVFVEFHLPRPGEDWRSELRERSVSARQVLLRHPWALGLMDSRRNAGMENLRHHDAVIGCLRAAGFSVPLIGHAYALLDAHLYGFVLQEINLAFDDEADLAEMISAMMARMDEGGLGYLREFSVEQAMQPGYDFGNEFEPGLDLILSGLAALREQETATADPVTR